MRILSDYMQKILKSEKSIVIVDDREKNTNITNYLEEKGLVINFIRLDVGDYVISERVCIERKTADDFVNSIIDGRVFRQIETIKINYPKAVLLIEGNNFRRSMNENAIKAAISTLVVKYDASVIMTKDEDDTAKIIYWLARKEQEDNKNDISIVKKKKPKDVRKLQEHVLLSFPGISTVLSKRLLEHFRSIKSVMNATEEELIKVKRISEKQVKKIHALLNEKYEVDE